MIGIFFKKRVFH